MSNDFLCAKALPVMAFARHAFRYIMKIRVNCIIIKSMRILIVEDESKVAEFIRKGLCEEGYAADIAFEGEDALSLALTSEYDLILMDIMIPGIDGISLCSRIRAEGLDVPVLMLTAKDAVKDKVAGLDAGADDYLTKPFAFEELLARIRALLRKKYIHKNTRLQIEDLILDVLTHKVTRGGKEISLSMKEFSLLEYLMTNSGSVVTRTMIAEHVWDINFDTFTNVIDVYINYLRNKIDKGFESKLIHSVRGRGYILKKQDA